MAMSNLWGLCILSTGSQWLCDQIDVTQEKVKKKKIPKRLMTQIVCGVSICYNNSRHFRMSDFGLSTQSLPIQRHSDLGCTGRKLGLGWKAANKGIKLKRSTQYMLSIRRLTEVPSSSKHNGWHWFCPTFLATALLGEGLRLEVGHCWREVVRLHVKKKSQECSFLF